MRDLRDTPSLFAVPLVRPYRADDRDACLAVFDTNRPRYFTADERGLFERFLARTLTEPDRPFYVAEDAGTVRGCGGHRVDTYGIGYLAWGMVDARYHGQGFGTAVLDRRLAEIHALPRAWCVVLDTSQHTAPFYARFGFEPVQTVRDGYQPGLDTVYMRRLLRGGRPRTEGD